MHLFDVVLKPFSICEWFVTKFTLVISHFFMHYLKTGFFLFNDFKTLKEMHLQLHSWLSCSWRTLTCLLFTCTSLKMIVKIGLFCKGFITQFTFEPYFLSPPNRPTKEIFDDMFHIEKVIWHLLHLHACTSLTWFSRISLNANALSQVSHK